jgi:hypothetical protein
MHQTYMQEIGAVIGSLLALDSLSPLERSSLLTQDNLCPRERGLTIAAAVVNQHTGTPILFT